MAATNYTPISLYYSTTASATPSAGNLVNGELALNIQDEKLYFKNAAGTVKLLASNAATTPTTPGGSNTQVQYNSSGSFAGSSNFTFDGTNIGLGGGTANGVTYLNGSKVLTSGSALQFDGNTMGLGATPSSWYTSYFSGVLEGKNGSFWAPYANSPDFYIGTNLYYASGGWTYKTTAAASFYRQTTGQHEWYTAPSGTAGALATTTLRMTLDSTQLGIGTATNRLGEKLHVLGYGITTSSAENTNLGLFGTFNTSTLICGSFSNIPFLIRTNNTEVARYSTAGGYSVGTTADPGAGAIYATGNITAYYSSDIKFKENVRAIPDALATVKAIGGKLFDWTDEYIESKGGADGYFVQKADFGVVAQDVQRVFPIAVRTRPDGSLAVDYEKLGALAFAAIEEQDAIIEKQDARIAKLEAMVAKLIEG